MVRYWLNPLGALKWLRCKGIRMSGIHRANSFDFARLLGSLLVLYSHSFAVRGAPEPRVLNGTRSFGGLGLLIFFSISGYLVTMSWLADANVLRFAIRRCLRIFPALAVVIVLSVFVLGPLVTTLPLGTYFRNLATYQYLEDIGLYIHYFLPGCFEQTPIANTVNGSLWSMPPEFLMYVVLGALGCLTLLKRRLFTLLFGCAVAIGDLYLIRSTPLTVPLLGFVLPPHPAPILFYGMDLHQVMGVAPYFWSGCIFCLYRDRIKLNLKITVVMFMVMALLPPGYLLAVWSFIAVPYILLAFCTQSDPAIVLPAWFGDLSYGVYIYAFPVQQTVYYFWHEKLSAFAMLLLTIILTFACAFVSWHVIESPMLRLKPKRRLAPAVAP